MITCSNCLSPISLSIMLSRSICIVANGRIPFILMTNIPLCIYIPYLYPLICWRTQITSISWLIMLLWTLGYMYLFKLVFLFFSYTYLVVEMLDLLTVLFSVFWGASILFQSGHTNSQSYQQCTEILFSVYPHQH